jgi:hypothetical protein
MVLTIHGDVIQFCDMGYPQKHAFCNLGNTVSAPRMYPSSQWDKISWLFRSVDAYLFRNPKLAPHREHSNNGNHGNKQ